MRSGYELLSLERPNLLEWPNMFVMLVLRAAAGCSYASELDVMVAFLREYLLGGGVRVRRGPSFMISYQDYVGRLRADTGLYALERWSIGIGLAEKRLR